MNDEILVIEDEPMVQSVISQTLQADGYTVHVAPDAALASEFMREHGDQIRLMIVDSGLPVMPGEKLASDVVHDHPDICVLLISGYPEGKRTEDSPAPSFPFLQKPFTGKKLSEVVAQLMSRESCS